MTTGTTAEAVEIACGLTKAQRDWLVNPCYADPNSIRSLRRKGIVGERQRGLTSLGLAVREALIHGGGHG